MTLLILFKTGWGITIKKNKFSWLYLYPNIQLMFLTISLIFKIISQCSSQCDKYFHIVWHNISHTGGFDLTTVWFQFKVQHQTTESPILTKSHGFSMLWETKAYCGEELETPGSKIQALKQALWAGNTMLKDTRIKTSINESALTLLASSIFVNTNYRLAITTDVLLIALSVVFSWIVQGARTTHIEHPRRLHCRQRRRTWESYFPLSVFLNEGNATGPFRMKQSFKCLYVAIAVC